MRAAFATHIGIGEAHRKQQVVFARRGRQQQRSQAGKVKCQARQMAHAAAIQTGFAARLRVDVTNLVEQGRSSRRSAPTGVRSPIGTSAVTTWWCSTRGRLPAQMPMARALVYVMRVRSTVTPKLVECQCTVVHGCLCPKLTRDPAA